MLIGSILWYFFAVESLSVFGTVRYMVFFVTELRSRAVQVAGIRITPDDAWMLQVARNLLDAEDGFLRNATHLVHDRDPLYTKAWTTLLKSEGVASVRILRLCSTIPPPWFNMVRYFGVLSSHSRHRARVVPKRVDPSRFRPPAAAGDQLELGFGSGDEAGRGPASQRSRWVGCSGMCSASTWTLAVFAVDPCAGLRQPRH